MKKAILIAVCVIFVNTLIVFAQTHEETKAEVKELSAFHEVIFQLWHDAWPNKNIALMKELVPAVDSNVAIIQKVELPGILRDKKVRWDENVKSLVVIAADYNKATSEGDTQKCLDATEKLHAQYEKLVRTIRPVLKEVDEFHQVLYPLYHYYMPEDNHAKIKSSVKKLQAKMDLLNKVELPDKMAEKRKSFLARRSELNKAVKYLNKVVQAIDDTKTIKDAIEEMHTKYQSLEKVFD